MDDTKILKQFRVFDIARRAVTIGIWNNKQGTDFVLSWGIHTEDELKGMLAMVEGAEKAARREDLTTHEAAVALGVSVRRVQKLCRDGRIGYRRGRQYYVPQSDIANFIRRGPGGMNVTAE